LTVKANQIRAQEEEVKTYPCLRWVATLSSSWPFGAPLFSIGDNP
jgi:hypothetical protein